MENMVKQNPNIKEELPELSKKLDDIRSSLKQWEEENINQNWYRTIPEKSETIARLNDTLEEQVKNFSKILNTELKQIQEKRQQVEQTTMNLNQSIVEKETRLKDLEDELDKILPGWLGGIIKVKDMIQIFPILILILNFYIVVLAFSLTRHYDYVKQQVNLSRTDSKDLSASTVWTLTNRGRLGNTLTILVYVIFMLIMAQFYEMGHGYLLDWKNNLTEEQISWYLKILCSTEFLWISRFLFLSSASIILFAIELRKFAISRKEDK